MDEKKETPKFDGISAQINLSPGSETHRRFAEMMRNSWATTARSFVEMLMDSYENPPQDADSAATIDNLERLVSKCQSENDTYVEMIKAKDDKISDLETKLKEAINTANENAGKAQSIELAHQGTIVIKPNPVVKYFLEEMSRETGKTPAQILQSLYIDDLQNPRANNLPYIVTSARIREVMEELKNQQQ